MKATRWQDLKHKRPPSRLTGLTVSWSCGCGWDGAASTFEIYISGGCSGHGPDEYCYCPPEEARVRAKCVSCNRWSDFLCEAPL